MSQTGRQIGPQTEPQTSRRRLATTAAIIGLVVAINASARQQLLDAPVEANQFAAFVFSGKAMAAAHDLLRPGSGEQDLPPDVLDMLRLVRSHDVRTFSLSPRIAGDVLSLQRLTESAFPRRIVAKAHDRLALVSEGRPAGCRTTATAHGVVLARCP